jgi:hypothetical protein
MARYCSLTVLSEELTFLTAFRVNQRGAGQSNLASNLSEIPNAIAADTKKFLNITNLWG